VASALVKFPLVIRMDSKGWLRRNGYRVGLVLVAFFASVFLPALAQTTDWASLIQAAKPAVVWILAETSEGVPPQEAGRSSRPMATSSPPRT
jgi:hypothetical protein